MYQSSSRICQWQKKKKRGLFSWLGFGSEEQTEQAELNKDHQEVEAQTDASQTESTHGDVAEAKATEEALAAAKAAEEAEALAAAKAAEEADALTAAQAAEDQAAPAESTVHEQEKPKSEGFFFPLDTWS